MFSGPNPTPILMLLDSQGLLLLDTLSRIALSSIKTQAVSIRFVM